MQPSRGLWRRGPDLLAADATTLAQAMNALHMHLAAQNFVPGLDLDLGTLVEATFPGYAALDVGLGNQPIFYDALSNLLTIRLLEPVGGWNWVSTGVPGVPETIYGLYLTDNADAILYGSQLLPDPVTISTTGQGVGVGDVTLQFLLTSPF